MPAACSKNLCRHSSPPYPFPQILILPIPQKNSSGRYDAVMPLMYGLLEESRLRDEEENGISDEESVSGESEGGE